MDPVKSATRTLEVLSFFAENRYPAALKEICEVLKYPQSSMTVLLKTLTAIGYLNYDRSRRLYFPTLRVTSLGEWIPCSLFNNAEILELQRDIFNATGETVVLAISNDIYVEYVSAIPSLHPLRFDVGVGSTRLIHESPLGWLLMARMKSKDVEKLIMRASVVDHAEASSDKSKEAAMEGIEHVHQHGYSYGENTPFLGGATLGFVLPVELNGRPVVLGCGGVIERMRADKDRHIASIQSILGTFNASDIVSRI